MLSFAVYTVVTVNDVADYESTCDARSTAVRLAKMAVAGHDLDPEAFDYKAQFVDFWGKHPYSTMAQYRVTVTAKDHSVEFLSQITGRSHGF